MGSFVDLGEVIRDKNGNYYMKLNKDVKTTINGNIVTDTLIPVALKPTVDLSSTIGQLINIFDNADDNTVKGFNELFNTSLEHPNDSIVEIGEPLVGGFRELNISHEDGTSTEQRFDLSEKTMVWSRKLNKFVKKEGFYTGKGTKWK